MTDAQIKPLSISIIINNYNYARFLEKAIESALSQTYKNIELIIVDDGSTDSSAEIIERYADRAVVIIKKNGGQASAFNVGIERATGDLILLLDSDDYLFPEAVEACVDLFPAGYSRVYFRLRVTDEYDNVIVDPNMAVPFLDLDGSAILAAAERLVFPSVPTSGNMFDARILKAILPIPETDYRICADNFILVRTAEYGHVRSIDRELGAYRIHGNNNFSSAISGLLTEKKRLETHLDNYHKSTRLIERACLNSGFDPRKFTQRLTMDFQPLNLLCAAYAHMLDSPYVSSVSRKTLTISILDYLRSGNDTLKKRILQAAYLVLVVWLPNAGSMYLLRLMDTWQRRAKR